MSLLHYHPRGCAHCRNTHISSCRRMQQRQLLAALTQIYEGVSPFSPCVHGLIQLKPDSSWQLFPTGTNRDFSLYPLFSGVKCLIYWAGYGRGTQLFWWQDIPLHKQPELWA